jgi:hypothetical protein
VAAASGVVAATALPIMKPSSAADLLPDTVAKCQAMFDNKNDSTWRAADGNVTVGLPSGLVAWAFGDTLRKDRPAVHNSILVEQGDRLTSTTGGQAIPSESNGDYYWPTDGTVDGGLLRLFAGRVATTNGTFESRGMALVTFRFDSRGYPVYSSKRAVTNASEDTGVQWGTSLARSGGYLYVYGQQRRLSGWVFGRDVYLARVPTGSLSNRSAWTYWTGSGWVSDAGRAARIEKAETGRFASSFSVDKIGSRWLVESKENDMLGDKVIRMESGSPTGPFTTVSSISAPGTDTQWAYQAKGHPELPLGNDRFLVTWNLGSSDSTLLSGTLFPKPRCGEAAPG